jgi:ribosome maturation factor RimP
LKNVDIDKLTRITDEVVRGMVYELVDLDWKHEAGAWVLRVYIDHDDGVGLDDCARVSRALSATLDVEDLIPVHYNLEVSSPGLDRPLRTEAHFRRYLGRRAKIRTRRPLGEAPGRRNFSGTLVGVEGGGDAVGVRIDVGDGTWLVPIAEVERANLVYDPADVAEMTRQ